MLGTILGEQGPQRKAKEAVGEGRGGHFSMWGKGLGCYQEMASRKADRQLRGKEGAGRSLGGIPFGGWGVRVGCVLTVQSHSQRSKRSHVWKMAISLIQLEWKSLSYQLHLPRISLPSSSLALPLP